MATIKSDEGYINHYGSIRLRVNGSANLFLRLLSLDEVNESVLVPLVLANSTNREVVRLCNFKEQKAQLELSTTEIDENFVISKIVFFTRPSDSEFPG